MRGVLGAALAERHRNELVAIEDRLADEIGLVLGRRDLGAETRGLALVGHDDAGDGVHVLLESHIAPDRSPETHAGHGNDHPAVPGLEDRELARLEGSRQVVEQREDILAVDAPAVLVDDIGVDELVVGPVTGRQRREDGVLLLVEFVLVLAFLESQRGQREQRGHDDDHHRRVHNNIGIAVLVAEQALLLRLQLGEFRGGNSADGAVSGRGVSFVDVAADVAFEFFRCHNSLPYFASLTRLRRREMLASTT